MARRFSQGVASVLFVSAACSSTSVQQADVQAAKACQAFYLYVAGTAAGPDTLNAITPLLGTGTQPPSPSGQAVPSASPSAKWATLGNDLLKATGAAFTHDGKKLKLFGDKAAIECASIPAAAKKTAGFNH